MSGIVVAMPCHNARHRLWHSLGSLAGQSLPPTRILVLDLASTDGTADWLRLRWPGVEIRPLPADATPAMILEAVSATLGPAIVTFLAPGDRLPAGHLEALERFWAEAPEADVLRSADTDAAGVPHLSALSIRGSAWRPGSATPTASSLAATIWAGARQPAAPSMKRAQRVVVRPDDGWPALRPGAAARQLAAAAETLADAETLWLVDLEASTWPAGLLNLLGAAAMLGPVVGEIQAATLADLGWELLATRPAAPLVVTMPAALDETAAAQQLCIEELVARSGERPVRLLLRSLLPTSPQLGSRLVRTLTAHPDLELWLADAVSARYAAALLGNAQVRLVPPPLLALAAPLREIGTRQLLLPGMLGVLPDADEPARSFTDLQRLRASADPEPLARIARALARVLGLWRWLRGPNLDDAWSTALTAWAQLQLAPSPVRTADLDLALLAGMCGKPAILGTDDPKLRDVAATWPALLTELGIAEAGRAVAA